VLNFYDNASGFFPEIALQKRSGIEFAKKNLMKIPGEKPIKLMPRRSFS